MRLRLAAGHTCFVSHTYLQEFGAWATRTEPTTAPGTSAVAAVGLEVCRWAGAGSYCQTLPGLAAEPG